MITEQPGKHWPQLFPFLFSAVVAYGLSLFLRLVEFPLWMDPLFHITGEPLMATHDAYAWMAGAKGTGIQAGKPMSVLLQFAHTITGMSLSTLNFWLPALAAPLVAIPLALVCAWWMRPEAGISAGIIGAGTFGFLYRTRLGYGDTDILTLLFPLIICILMVFLLSLVSREKKGSFFSLWTLSFGLGLVAFLFHWFYSKGFPITFLILLSGYGLAFFLYRKEWKSLVGSIAIVLCLWLGGWFGFPVAIAALLVAKFRPLISQQTRFVVLIALLSLFSSFANGALLSLFSSVLSKLLVYSKILVTTGEGLPLPDRMLSVREAQTVDWSRLMARTGVHWSIFLAGIVGYLLLIRKHLSAIVFLPLLILAIFSFKLGNRFTMFGGPVIGLGFGFLISEVLRRASARTWLPWFGQIAGALLVVSIIFQTATHLQPSPILPQAYAQTFLGLREKTSLDAQLWQWWDYGYAAQYYAERRTLDDGGRQKGLFPLALVHTSTSPLQAAQIMKFSAQTEVEQRQEMVHNGTKPINSGAKILYYPTDPLLPLKEMENPRQAQAFVETLAKEQLSWPADLSPQYLVLSWENMKLAYWISYFGNWNLETGKGVSGQIRPLRGQLNIDMENGTLQTGDSQVPLVELSMVSGQKTESRSWDREDGFFLVINQLSSEAYLMDRSIFESMMVRMLLGDPEEFVPYFELVEDRYPWVRAYLVK
jgi:undecaprenyl-diphosphooligosaccharide---protein glycotransferase